MYLGFGRGQYESDGDYELMAWKTLLFRCWIVLVSFIAFANIGSAVDIFPNAYYLIQEEGVDLVRRLKINFTGSAITCTDDSGNGTTDCDVTGGGGGGHTFKEEGTPLTARAGLNCIGVNVTCVDDAGGDETELTVTTIGIAGGGTGQVTKTPAYDALSPNTTKGDIAVYDGTNNVRLAAGTVAQFLRVNSATATGLEWTSSTNFDVAETDTTDAVIATNTLVAGIAFVPPVDTWVQIQCVIMYRTATTTTGISISLFANNAGRTSPAQLVAADVSIGGVAADGTGSLAEWTGSITSSEDMVTATGVVAINTDYIIKIDGVILTHASDATSFIAPIFTAEAATTVTVREGSSCGVTTFHADV